MNQQKTKAFTLVELIVVITILAILGTIAFISLQGYSKDARDSTRLSDINNIKISLELFSLAVGKYPLPDNSETISYDTDDVWYQGVVGDNMTKNLKNLNHKPTDPLLNTEYIYSTTNSQKEYEVLALYEGDQIASNILISQTYAEDNLYPKVDGTYNQVYVKTSNYIVPTPSIITSETLPFLLTGSTIESQVITGGSNIPAIGGELAQTGGLVINLSATGILDGNSTDTDKISVIKSIQAAYTGTSIASNDIYAYILNQTTSEEMIALAHITLLKGVTTVTTSEGGGEVLTGWRILDPNCKINDITIGSQIWAGCNSTIGNGVEFGKKDNGTDGTASCYDYNGGTGAICTIDSIEMASNTNANVWFTGTNINGDTEVDNIWGKFYTWANSDSACGTGYHVPSDNEWEILETTLNGGTNCRISTDLRRCGGLGWKLHNTRTIEDNIIEALKIPISGRRDTDGSNFLYRGFITNLWASTQYDGSTARGRQFLYSNTTVYRSYWDKSLGFNVRCIKD